MATNLLCIDDQCFVTPSAGTKATSLPKAVNRVASGSAVEGHLADYWGGTGNIVNRTVNASGVAENQSYYFGRFTSKPLAAQTIPAQSWNWSFILGEGAAQANTYLWPVMYVWRPGVGIVSPYILNTSAQAGTEIAATPGSATRNYTGSAVTVEDGDLLVVEAWMAGTPSASAHLQTWRLTANNSLMVSPYTILWKPDTILFFQETTPSVVPTAGAKVSSSYLPKAQHTNSTKSGTEGLLTTTLVQNPLGRDGNALAIAGEQSIYWGRHSTIPLAAQTIPVQEWYWGVSCGTQKTDAVWYHYPVLYIWRPSTNSVVGWIFDGSVAMGQKWRYPVDPLMSQRFTGAAVTCQDGDILCCEVWSVGVQGTAAASVHQVWTTARNSSLECPYVLQFYVAPPALSTLALTEAPDTISASATVVTPPVLATLTRTEAPDTISATATVVPFPVINATLTRTEDTDALDADVSSVSIPKIGTLQEDFEAPADPGKWDTTNVFNGTTVFNNGYGEFTTTSLVNTTHASLVSVGNFSLKDSAVFWKIVRPPTWTAIAGGGEFSLAVESPGDNRIDWTIYSSSELALITFTNNGWGYLKQITANYYNEQDTYRWLRTRETAGTTYFESAPTTASNPPLEGEWVVRHSVATNTLPINAGINNVKAVYRLWISATAQGAMTQSARIDGFNTAASGAPTGPSTGTLALTEAPDTISATAKATAGATLTRTEAPDTIAATAVATAGAILTRTEAPDTIAATASSGMTATLTRTEAPDTIVSTASSGLTASLSVTEAGDTLAAVASSPATGTLTLTEAPDTIAATASVLPFPTINASLTVQEAPDQVASASGSPAAIADLSRTEAPDTLVAMASSGIGATLARTESPDAISATARVVAGASLARTEAPDSIASSATSPATGNLSKQEFDDTISSIARVAAGATLAVQEAPDTLVATASVVSAIFAELSILEDTDLITATAAVSMPVATGNLSVTEAGDTLMGYAHHAKKRVILVT